MSDGRDRNQRIIEEFRANEGRVGGPFEGAPLLLLHHTGRRSGVERVNPMMYQAVGDAYAVFASKAGADVDPDWYLNLKANPDAVVEVGTRTVPVRARVLDAAEREPIWRTQKSRYPGFQAYEDRTDRVIPVVLLEARDA
ncbi:nitroreductase family deazaflavin-dependent oxidoreductase [Pseudonocardia acaciae]|uniref:nitroreductase family deazaflavin-dependent oxidoreductase n=1 Tax=Pseudonocardia acaciae TaxID=551276 RepID=UPI00049133E0|nr:nitroreductase family deazaflavin-dependent oxidoreductase [Pseudonocardia acaciae]